MATETSSPEPSEQPLTIDGVRLADIIDSAGPFGSLFVGPGSNVRTKAQVAIDSVPVPAPHAGLLLAATEDSQAGSQVAISDGTNVWRFLLEDPLAADLARFGDIPSLGPIIEASQVTTPHVVVTIEKDVYGVTTFGTVSAAPAPARESPDQLADPIILEARDHLVDALQASHVQLVALIGSDAEIADLQRHLQERLPLVRCNAYPTDDIDRDLLSIADEVLRDAASLAAERRTHELAHFRQARIAAQTQEGAAALGAIEAGGAQRLLVHDDFAVEEDAGVTRAADRAIAAAIRTNVPITMIPNVPEGRGPKGGLGVIMRGHGAAVSASTLQPESVDNVRRGV